MTTMACGGSTGSTVDSGEDDRSNKDVDDEDESDEEVCGGVLSGSRGGAGTRSDVERTRVHWDGVCSRAGSGDKKHVDII